MQVFAFNTLFGIIFAILSWATFSVCLPIPQMLTPACKYIPNTTIISQAIRWVALTLDMPCRASGRSCSLPRSYQEQTPMPGELWSLCATV